MDKKSCYNCATMRHCAFRRDIENAVRKNLDFVDVDLPASDERQAIHIYKAVALACKFFTK